MAGFQYRLCLPSGACHDFVVPINLKVADIKGLVVMRLPALILPHWPREGNVVVVLTGHEPVTRDIRSIDQMDLGEQALLPARGESCLRP